MRQTTMSLVTMENTENSRAWGEGWGGGKNTNSLIL